MGLGIINKSDQKSQRKELHRAATTLKKKNLLKKKLITNDCKTNYHNSLGPRKPHSFQLHSPFHLIFILFHWFIVALERSANFLLHFDSRSKVTDKCNLQIEFQSSVEINISVKNKHNWKPTDHAGLTIHREKIILFLIIYLNSTIS